MVNTPLPDAVHIAQHNPRKRKASSEADEIEADGEVSPSPNVSPTFDISGVSGCHEPRRKLRIDMAAAAAASQCYREESRPGTNANSPCSISSSSTICHPPKLPRTSSPRSPGSPLNAVKPQRSKGLVTKRRLFRLYNRYNSPFVPPAPRSPVQAISYNPRSPAHTLSSGRPRSQSAPSSRSTSPITSQTTKFFRQSALTEKQPSPLVSSRGPCLHQSCVAFRFASMMDGVHLSPLTSSHNPLSQGVTRTPPVYVPPILPPINRYTLQELDLDAIMKNPQLRHDLLFDVGLQFRPTDSKRKRETADMYWCAIKSELEVGCSCVSFDDTHRIHRHACQCSGNLRYSGKNAAMTKPHLPCEEQLPIRVPSRIRALIEELREVTIAVVSPPPPSIPLRSLSSCPHQPGYALRPRRLSAADPSSIAWLHEAFDVPLVEQHLRHGIFDAPKLFTAVGDLLKKHCAPTRDSMVQTMIDVAAKCGSGKTSSLVDGLNAIRVCFELLELMRLDFANHLLAHIRPHLLASAPQFEWSLFSRRQSLAVPMTRAWFTSSYQRVTASPDLHNDVGKTLPPPTTIQSFPKVNKIVVSFLTGLVDLVVFPPMPVSATLPPSPTTTPVTKGHQTYQIHPLPGYPETLYLDHARLLMLTADAADINANFMLLSMFRQFVFASPSHDGSRISVDDSDLSKLKKELAAIGPSRPGLCFSSEFSLMDTEHTSHGSHAWRTAMTSALTHISKSIENIQHGKNVDSNMDNDDEYDHSKITSRFTPPSTELTQSVLNWCISHLHSESTVTAVFRKKLRAAVLKMVITRFFSLWNAGVQHRLGKSQNPFAQTDVKIEPSDEAPKIKTGLEPLSNEIRLLTERLSKLAVLHLRVYFPFYEQNEFVET